VNLRLATGPVSWGVDFADTPGNPPWTEVLDGVRAAGYSATELGPLGFLPADRAAFAHRGLVVTGGFVFEPLHDPRRLESILITARRVAARVRGLGGAYLVIIDAVSPERSATAGRPDDARRLRAEAQEAMLEAIAAVAAVARTEGLRPLVHPHAGTYMEFEDEISPVLPVCELCLDTGHCAYAGIDPVALYQEAGASVPYLHLKDLDPERVQPAFWESVAAGAFVPIGHGAVDFPALLEALARHGFDGWAVVEQDRVAGSGDPVAELLAGRLYLERRLARSAA
jgi:inosose dehydratase